MSEIEDQAPEQSTETDSSWFAASAVSGEIVGPFETESEARSARDRSDETTLLIVQGSESARNVALGFGAGHPIPSASSFERFEIGDRVWFTPEGSSLPWSAEVVAVSKFSTRVKISIPSLFAPATWVRSELVRLYSESDPEPVDARSIISIDDAS